LRRKQIERRLEVIQIEIAQAERDQDYNRGNQLTLEIRELNRRKLAIATSGAES
jgi:hypothetical protein